MSLQPGSLPPHPHDQVLLDNVHPADWVNPEPASSYNLLVVGGGPAGLVAAAGAAGLGAKVALVEKNLLGGDCLISGCVPSKGIIRSGRAIRDARNAAEFGVINGEKLRVDFTAAFDRMRLVRSRLSHHDSARRFRDELGVDVFFGAARFTGPDSLAVEEKTLRFHRAAICTGSSPSVPPVPGLEETGYVTNETVFSLRVCPERLTVIGGGPIGCELAQAFAYLGSTVTILNAGPRILPKEDPETSEFIHNALERDGIIIYNEVTLVEAAQTEGSKLLAFEQPDGQRFTLLADEILVGAGRTPNVGDLDLEQAGVDYDPRLGVRVDNHLRTGNRRIYAAGDVCSPYKFTHAADAMARILIANALFGGRQKVSNLIIPWCTYTTPEAAHVGLSRSEAEKKGVAVDTFRVSLSEVDRALLDGEESGFVTVHLKKGTDKILGATVVARNAGDMINEFTLAMTTGAGLAAIASTIHPYPTQGEAIKKLADSYNRTRLTPGLGKILSTWLRWKRN
ncbi:MAG: mercuric reductase [Deltaproteobacteria bacterium]|nr:mercuric reductase [Deltaproteobacteria bacterium]